MTVIDCSLPGIRIGTTATKIKAGNGTLRRIIAQVAGTVTVYDGIDTTGTIILNAFPIAAGANVQLDWAFQVGCYIAPAGGADITAIYY